MRIVCRHGHYAFFPRGAADVQRFAQFFNLDLVLDQEFYTFRNLKGLAFYSLKGKQYGNGPIAKVTFSGKPWEVMQANGFVYDLNSGLIVDKASIGFTTKLTRTDFYWYVETTLIQAGSFNQSGEKILNFDAELDSATNQLRVRSIF